MNNKTFKKLKKNIPIPVVKKGTLRIVGVRTIGSKHVEKNEIIVK